MTEAEAWAMAWANRGLVLKVATRYARRTDPDFDDLVQEVLIGLRDGALRYDPTLGFRFSTYGYWWIRRAVREVAQKRGRLIRYAPTHMTQAASELLDNLAAPMDVDVAEADEQSADLRLIDAAIAFLTAREQDVLRRRFFTTQTFRQMASDLGFSSSRAQQLEKAAIKKLRARLSVA